MKRFLSICLAIILMISASPLGVFNLTVGAETDESYTHGVFTYKLVNNEAVITEVVDTISGDVNVPSTLNGYTVTSIGDYAFYNCKKLTNITIPDCVTYIGSRAFAYCSKLSSISIPESVTVISDYAFFNCKGFTNITIPDSVTRIGAYAFCGCEKLERVDLPRGITSIGNEAFYSDTVIFGYKNSAFTDYVNSQKHDWYVYIDGTEQENVFSGKIAKYSWLLDKRSGILKLTGSDAMVDFTTKNAPWYDYRLYITSVELPKTLTKIGASAFYDCQRITGINIPDCVKSIGDFAFLDCVNLTKIIIPNSVTSIGQFAFSNCEKVTDITIGDNVQSIGSCAFYNTAYYNLLSNWEKDVLYIDDCLIEVLSSDSAEFKIKPGTTVIADSAFLLGDNITKIIIPESAISVGNMAFAYCEKLTDIIVNSINCAFDIECGLNYGQKIHGLKGSKAETFAAEIGAEFIDIQDTCRHMFDGGIVTKKPTCKESGIRIYTCTNGVCGKTKTKIISKLTMHTYSNACDNICNVCNATRTAADHKYTNNCDTTCNICKSVRTITHTFKTTLTKATLSKNGKTVQMCSVCGGRLTTTIYYPKTVKLAVTSYTYDGKAKMPGVTVKNSNGKSLKKGTDYTVTYANGRKNVGKYKVTVTFKGNYSGTKTFYFTINPAKTTVSKLTAGKKSITVAIAKKSAQVTGYEIQYATNKSFKSAKTKTVNSYKTTSVALKKLSAKKTYYVRVRTYKTVGKTKYYSAWSVAKNKKTK